MMYKNGRDALPPSLLKEIQKYIQGDLIYIPKATEERARWGEKSGARKQLAQRNAEISLYYSKGWSVSELEQKYHLSSESIRKIVVKSR
ncbi:CD3324 family protein [Paenibacillus urinalis]|uniref:CD3324 family protein n=3 Tax=Paenibacillus TaxID=44249 RepID=A0AAX3MWE0_9BACL|nr:MULTISPECIES: CD3324 family protein [Paenibacillus]MCM3126405.1 CD3324 family protein [Paenibacillus sp. MER 78]OMC68825.1 hypothetical protein BK126_13550 [Paenibacillus sp. FSL H7-0326]WDH81383.1 CD3324 family protein [Paenibacillus urinalis]WDH97432.1 CD3324 family protein [Paenibacillus urinalis]WDI01099.1 CD3324 family protein [Paenibacillus urinalis]